MWPVSRRLRVCKQVIKDAYAGWCDLFVWPVEDLGSAVGG